MFQFCILWIGVLWGLMSGCQQTLETVESSTLNDVDTTQLFKLEKVGFGSCADMKSFQPQIWNTLFQFKLQGWLWLGDRIYSDCSQPICLLNAYKALYSYLPFSRFHDSLMFEEGTWDDHDYGINDGGRENPYRAASQKIFLDHLNVNSHHSRRLREGVYSSHLYGKRYSPEQQVKLIFLDTRYHRDPHAIPTLMNLRPNKITIMLGALIRACSSFLGLGNSYEGDILGATQWNWLKAQLENSTAAVHIIVSSIQIFTTVPIVESWGLFPMAKKRLLNLLNETKPRGLILLSGDVHYAEIIEIQDLLEVTSSGLTHSIHDKFLQRLFIENGFLKAFVNNYEKFYPKINFGMLQFQYQPYPAAVHVNISILGEDGTVHLQTRRTFEYDQNALQIPSSIPNPIWTGKPMLAARALLILMLLVLGALTAHLLPSLKQTLYPSSRPHAE